MTQKDKSLYLLTMTSDDLWEIVKTIHSNKDDLSEGDLYDRVHACDNYELIELPVKSLNPDEWGVFTDKVDEYLNLDPNQMPPIVVHKFGSDHYSIVDGIHRLNVMIRLKQKKIKAYVGKRK